MAIHIFTRDRIQGSERGSEKVERLREAYRSGDLVVAADRAQLEWARREGVHAIDAREIAATMLSDPSLLLDDPTLDPIRFRKAS